MNFKYPVYGEELLSLCCQDCAVSQTYLTATLESSSCYLLFRDILYHLLNFGMQYSGLEQGLEIHFGHFGTDLYFLEGFREGPGGLLKGGEQMLDSLL
jgi:hypothetical protein